MEQITLRVPSETKESLEDEADRAGKTLSEYLREIIRTRDNDNESEKIRKLRERLEEHRDRINDLRDDREERIRLEAHVERLKEENERLREERDQAKARYHETQGKLKVHHSERGALKRAKGWLFGNSR